MNKHEGMKRGFHHFGAAWYSFVGLPEGIVDEVTFGYYNEQNGTTTGSLTMTWHMVNWTSSPRLEVFYDAWDALNSLQDVLATLAAHDNQAITPAEFCTLLLGLGFVDMTERERPTVSLNRVLESSKIISIYRRIDSE